MLNRIAGLTLIPIASFLILLSIYMYTMPNKEAPSASHGRLDLSGWDFKNDGLVNLDGEWEYYRNKLLSTEDLQSGTLWPDGYIRFPSAWAGISSVPEEADYGVGSATYRLTLKLQESSATYGLKINNINSAHRLFVNGVLRGESGTPSERKASYRPGNTPYATFINADGPELVIVLHVSNFSNPNVGGVDEIQFGFQKDIILGDNVRFGTELAGVFVLLMFAGYHISIYVMRFKDKAYLYSGLFFLTMLLVLVTMGEKQLFYLWPSLPYEAASKIYLLGGLASYTTLSFFLHHLDAKLLSRRHLLVLATPVALFSIAIMVIPDSAIQVLGDIPWDYCLLLTVFYFYRTVRLFLKQDGAQLNRSEVALLGGAMLSVVFIMVYGLFYSLGWVETNVGRYIGLLSVIAFMNTLLALRLALATEQSENLSKQLMLRDQLKDEFLATTSHELKTPLHGIQNIASYLLEEKAGALTNKQRSELTLIQDTSTKLSALVNDLIDAVQMRRGALRLQESIVDMYVLTRTVLQVLEFEMTGKDIRCVNRVAPNTLALADENRVRQVLYNLIHNAIKHTNSGWIVISAQETNGKLSIKVEDTGIGIPKDSHEAIFGYFEQVERTLPQDGYTVMGLGLYISRQLVERMGGKIGVEWSEVGKGTRIAFTLPLAASPPKAEDDAFELVSATAERNVYMGLDRLEVVDEKHTHTVLVVDDEAANIRILLNMLGDRYNVLTALSAKEALRKLEANPGIDLLILDVMMPEMSGIDLCRTIRQTHSIIDLPILFATVKNAAHDIELCFREGGNDFIAKPFDPKTLAARVHTLLSMKSSMEQALNNELAFLQAQIKPHFLYNAISSIISFCYTDGTKAAYLLSMLSRYLRFMFERDHESMYIPLRIELEFIQAYVEIEKARFGERFEFRLHLEPDLNTALVPSLCIQPFVENAIRHGLFNKEGAGRVSLSITDGDGYMRVEIADNGVGMADDLLYRLSTQVPSTDAGIGITNVRKRISSIPRASLTIDSAIEQGTKVTIYLPKIDADHERDGSENHDSGHHR